MSGFADTVGSFIPGMPNSNKAADAQVQAAREARAEYQKMAEKAIAEQRGGLAEGRGDLEQYLAEGQGNIKDYLQQGGDILNPYLTAGTDSLEAYLNSMGMGGEDGYQNFVDQFHKSPGYEFQMQQGQQAIDRSAAAKGMGKSGALTKATMRFGQGLANQEFGSYQDRLAAMAEQGLGAAGRYSDQVINAGRALGDMSMETGRNKASLGEGYYGRIGDYYSGIGTSNAESQLAQGNARAGAISNRRDAWDNGIEYGIDTGMAAAGKPRTKEK